MVNPTPFAGIAKGNLLVVESPSFIMLLRDVFERDQQLRSKRDLDFSIVALNSSYNSDDAES